MILYLLDTDTLSLYRGGHPQVIRRINEAAMSLSATLSVSVITVEETQLGWNRLLRRATTKQETVAAYENLASAVELLAFFTILRFSEAAALRFEQLLAAKLNVGKMDLRIAAIALEHNAILITRNTRDFARIPELKFEDWTQ